MLTSSRTLAVITVANLGVFLAASWAAGGGFRPDGLALTLIAANTLPLLLLRWNPLGVVLLFAAVYPAWVITEHPTHILQSLPSLTALYATGEWGRPLWLRSLALVSPAFMFAAAISGWWGDVDPLEIGYVVVVFVVVWGLGALMAARRAHVAELEAKTVRLERAERRLAEQAVAEERARIARELHDVVAHAMSVITVQAGVGAHLIETRPAQASDALRTIENTGREAMEEMRRMLAVLKGYAGSSSLAEPQPGLGDIDRLADQVRASGVEVSIHRHGASQPVGRGLELAAYRVVQEALTNVVKHAPGSVVEVFVRRPDDRLEVEVTNTGPAPRRFEEGQGLRGMAERVALYDGRLDVGSGREGFRVHAVFPETKR